MEVSIVADNPKDASRHIASNGGKLISLTEKPLLTIHDFTTANVSLTESQIVLNVTMTPDSAKRVQTFTASHIGKRIAFLVNGRIINTPKIQDPITGNGFLIGPFREDEARTLADSINHKKNGCEQLRKNRR